MKGQLLAAMVESINTRKDKTVKIVIGTQELSPMNAGQLFQLMNQIVSVYICPSTIDNREIEQIDKIDAEIEGKTPSKRLRDVIYVLFTQQPEGYKDFDSFYKYKMSVITDHLKSKLQ